MQADILQHTFIDLLPSTEYEFEVFAHTDAGLGDPLSNNFTTSPANENGKFSKNT